MFQHNELIISYINKAYYHYVQHNNSITNAYTRKTYEMRLFFLDYLKEIISEEIYSKEIRHSKLSIFAEAFVNNVLSEKEIRKLIWENKRAAFLETRSIRWFIIYFCMLIGWISCSKKIVKF